MNKATVNFQNTSHSRHQHPSQNGLEFEISI
ncbi:hypothetical protein SRDD_12350 [Serratia sp. DD3]|nr:hypothetical protein SRDD_12350 [Serratia sp. DD3]